MNVLQVALNEMTLLILLPYVHFIKKTKERYLATKKVINNYEKIWSNL